MDSAKAATPHAELITQLLDPNVPKTEREHAAVREIERLRAEAERRTEEHRCSITGNLCGTDTWKSDSPPDCQCGRIVRSAMADDRAIEALAYERQQGNALRAEIGQLRVLLIEWRNFPPVGGKYKDDLIARTNAALRREGE